MAAVRNERVQHVKIKVLGADLASELPQKSQNPNELRILSYHDAFTQLLHSLPAACILLTSYETSRNPFFVNACVYLPEYDELYLTSSLLASTSSSHLPQILISKVCLERRLDSEDIETAEWRKLRPPPSIPNPAGACAYEKGILYCSQGALHSHVGGLKYMPQNKPPVSIVEHYGGKRFNSPQRVCRSPTDGCLWFTDSDQGVLAGIKAEALLPSFVYRYDPVNHVTRVMVGGLESPGAIAFAPNGETLYISDWQGRKNHDGARDSRHAGIVYAYDISRHQDQPFAVNKRVFAVVFNGVADDLICDAVGNVFAACGDGVEIWSPGGVPLGLIEIVGGCSSFSFGKRKELFIAAGQRLWLVTGLAVGS